VTIGAGTHLPAGLYVIIRQGDPANMIDDTTNLPALPDAGAGPASIVGFFVLPSSPSGTIVFVPTLAVAKHRRDGWDCLVARVWSDGAGTAGDDREAGFCGMGLGGDYNVGRAAEWLATRSAQWLRKNGIVFSLILARGRDRTRVTGHDSLDSREPK